MGFRVKNTAGYVKTQRTSYTQERSSVDLSVNSLKREQPTDTGRHLQERPCPRLRQKQPILGLNPTCDVRVYILLGLRFGSVVKFRYLTSSYSFLHAVTPRRHEREFRDRRRASPAPRLYRSRFPVPTLVFPSVFKIRGTGQKNGLFFLCATSYGTVCARNQRVQPNSLSQQLHSSIPVV